MKIGGRLVSLLIVMLLIASIPLTAVHSKNMDPTPDPYPQLDADKKVWDEATHSWQDEITVEVGSIVRFKISVTYTDIPGDNGTKMNRILIVDTLDDFEYRGNASSSMPGIDPDEYLRVNGDLYAWFFGMDVILSESIEPYTNVFYLEFDAQVPDTGVLTNKVRVRGFETCAHEWRLGRALARVYGSPEGCGECDGKITQLTLRYTGVEPVVVSVKQKKPSDEIFNDTVQPGEDFTFNGTDKKGTMGTEISLFVDGTLDVKIHTSCSEPIAPGMSFGSFLIIDGYSRNGGRLCPVDGGVILGDLDFDRDVDCLDLQQLLTYYGTSSGATYDMGDLDGDGDVDLADLAALLANYETGS